MAENSYNASNITVLEGLEAVRKRPGMYIGSTGERGLHHLVYEVVDNSVDEALAGYCTEINITLMADGGVEVIDNGRGIPVDIHPVEKKPALEVVLTVLHAGGKFGDGGYSVSGGLHGVGISVVNALSTDLSVIVQRDGSFWYQEYKLGVPTAPVRKGDASTQSGTTVQFWPSKEIFETTDFSFEVLSTRFREMAFLNKGLILTLTDMRAGHVDEKGEQLTVRYEYDGGIADFVKHLNSTRGETHKSIISFASEDKKNKISLEVSMQWNAGFSESVYTFANTIHTHEGGSHEEGFRTALTSIVNKFGEEQGFIRKKEDRLTGDDVREGLTAIVSIKLVDPQFEGQTKTKLGNSEAKTFTQKIVNEELTSWFEQNPAEGKEIVRKSIDAARAELQAAGAMGQRLVLLNATDLASINAATLVGADLFRRMGFNVDLVSTDWGTLVARRASKNALDQGGWSGFFTFWSGIDHWNPASHASIRGHGDNAWAGWPTIPALEAQRDAWFNAPDAAAEAAAGREMQRIAFEEVPYVPTGMYYQPTAYRRNLTGMLKGQPPLFWNIRRA